MGAPGVLCAAVLERCTWLVVCAAVCTGVSASVLVCARGCICVPSARVCADQANRVVCLKAPQLVSACFSFLCEHVVLQTCMGRHPSPSPPVC